MRNYDSRNRPQRRLLLVFVRAEHLAHIQRIGIYKLLAIRQLVSVLILQMSRTNRREPQGQENYSYEFTGHGGIICPISNGVKLVRL
jgi:hypothetical protein